MRRGREGSFPEAHPYLLIRFQFWTSKQSLKPNLNQTTATLEKRGITFWMSWWLWWHSEYWSKRSFLLTFFMIISNGFWLFTNPNSKFKYENLLQNCWKLTLKLINSCCNIVIVVLPSFENVLIKLSSKEDRKVPEHWLNFLLKGIEHSLNNSNVPSYFNY